MPLTDTQRFMLVNHAGAWANNAQRLSRWPDDRMVSFVEAHMVAISLGHLERSVNHLSGTSEALDAAITEFRAAFSAANIRAARNALEHEEEYLAGRSPNAQLLGEPDTWPVRQSEGSWGTTLMGSQRLEQMRVLGKTYSLGPALDAIPAIHAALEEWLRGFRGW